MSNEWGDEDITDTPEARAAERKAMTTEIEPAAWLFDHPRFPAYSLGPTRPDERASWLPVYDQAALQAAREEGARQKLEYVAAWMIDGGYATGHGESMDGLLRELEEQCKERGARMMREAMQTEIRIIDNELRLEPLVAEAFNRLHFRLLRISITEVLKGN